MNKSNFWIIAAIIFVAAGLYGLKQYKSNAVPPDPAVLNRWTKGGSENAVALIEYSDFQCPACAAYQTVINRLVADFGDKLRLTYRHFPLLQIHRNSLPAAKAAEAAGAQGKFWEMHNVLFAKQTEWSAQPDPTDTFAAYAAQLGMDEQRFRADMKNGDLEKNILAQAEQGRRDGVNSTPTFFLNGVKLNSPQSYEEFRALIQAEVDALSKL